MAYFSITLILILEDKKQKKKRMYKNKSGGVLNIEKPFVYTISVVQLHEFILITKPFERTNKRILLFNS